MRDCPRCGHRNAEDRDFCEDCGTYLRWDRTHLADAVPAPAPEEDTAVTPDPPPADEADESAAAAVSVAPAPQVTRQYAAEPQPPRAAADPVVVTLRVPGEDGTGTQELTVSVEPAAQVVLIALVRNQSAIVDNYTLRMKGLPAEWAVITPPAVYLVPFGASESGYEREVEIRLRPPRAPESRAGPWPFALVATSKTQGTDVAAAHGTLVIGRYDELGDDELRPVQRSGRLRGRFAYAVRNRGNAPAAIRFSYTEGEEATRVAFAEDRLSAEPGQRIGSAFVVRPRTPVLFGRRPLERRFDVAARIEDSELPPVRKQGTFRQKAWIPRWLPITIPLVAVPAAAIALLLPHKVAVPNLKGQKPDAAQKVLTKAKLTLKVDQKDVTDPKAVGVIVDQDPPSGSKVSERSEITAWVGVGSTDVPVSVPNVCGKTLAAADTILRKLGLQAVPSPGPPPSTDAPLADEGCQLPAAGASVPKGTPVTVILKQAAPVTTGAVTGTTTSGSGGGGKPGVIKISELPVVAGLTAAAATAELVKLGVPFRLVRTLSASEAPGTVLGVDPAAPKELPAGEAVPLIVSAGAPKLVFDDGHDVFVLGSGAGDQSVALTPSIPTDEQQPTMNEAGTLVAYRGVAAGAKVGKLYVVDTKTQSATVLTTDAADYHRPSFAPQKESDLIAVIRQPADASVSDGDLCFIHVRAPGAVKCIANTNWNVSRPSWSPDGRAILVVAISRKNPAQTGVFEYVSAKPFSDAPGDWKPKGLVVHGSVWLAAWSPNGTQVAYSLKSTGGYQLFLAPVQNGVPGQAVSIPQTQACEIAWRSDGRLALSQYDCALGTVGQIVLIDPAQPAAQTRLVGRGWDPAWQPIVIPQGG